MNIQLIKCALAINLVWGFTTAQCGAEQQPATLTKKQSEKPVSQTSDSTVRSTTNVLASIQVQHVRMSAHGRIVDLRYKVSDAEQLKLVGNKELKPLLVDQKTGEKLVVPSGPKTGPLRNIGGQGDTNKTYIMLFSNPKQVIKPGSIVDLILGESTVKGLKVE